MGIEERAVGSPEGAGVFKYFAPAVGADGRIKKLRLNPTYAGKGLPDKALRMRDTRNTGSFPLWGE